ncbi:MAG: hypothetical protein A2X84_13265 [Desulfuromonadaceae bacterium GWC2_58_13]|nr:MAG: hypothetical protein A2X84_13265 [Desulfuromonadaceae bacterium GWC2_58_13]
MKRLVRIGSLLTAVAVVSCVTINIYFPAEEVRGAADKIVNEVWGDRSETPPAQAEPKGQPSSFLRFGLSSAQAAQDIDVSTPEIRAIRESMKQRADSLFPYLDAGQVGIGRDGLLKARSTDGLDLRSRGEVNRLVAAENGDRQRLYTEIARANGLADKTAEIQAIFADSWRDQAASGWFVETKDGSWNRK